MRALGLLPLVLAAACLGREGGEHERPPDPDAPAVQPGPATREGDERSSPSPADPAGEEPVVVVFMGTSLTAGFGLLRDEDRYTDQIQELADSARLPVRVVNAGVSGETSAGGLRRIDWILERPMDVLVVELGANDGLRGLDPGELERNLREVVRRARARHPGLRLVLAGMEAPPNLGARYTDRFRSVYPRVAADVGATLVPFLLDGVAGHPDLNQSDRIHPNREGHRRIAREVVWPVLEPVLREAVSGRSTGVDDP